MKLKIKKTHALQWLVEPLEAEPSFAQRRMFGCLAIYVHDRMMLVLADSEEEPWNGLMVCTSREHHPWLQARFSVLKPHAVLGKWLYVSQNHNGFEELAQSLVGLVQANSPYVGIVPKPKKKRLPQRNKKALR